MYLSFTAWGDNYGGGGGVGVVEDFLKYLGRLRLGGMA